jgi:hypothetical protein
VVVSVVILDSLKIIYSYPLGSDCYEAYLSVKTNVNECKTLIESPKGEKTKAMKLLWFLSVPRGLD